MASNRALLSANVLGRNICSFHLSKLLISHLLGRRRFHKQRLLLQKCEFGFLFDIDGVIVRGRKPLPFAKDAFALLTEDRKFKIPTLFVTNAGNCLRSRKAQQLSDWLGVEVSEEQVVLSHSPLKMFRQFHDKHVLVSGQGPIAEIAANLGFNRVTTIEQLTQHYPDLDKMDHSRRKAAPCAFEEFYPRIDAVLLFGEPVRWETPLQLILDVLLTNGKPSEEVQETPYPHIPILACNMDLLWMSEHKLPRLGHGCFLTSLESLYQKITGKELKYTALCGKPSEITYHHADFILTQQAKMLGVDHIRTIYCVGDNPETDIYGGNLYNRYLQRRRLVTSTSRDDDRKRVKLASPDAEFLDEDADDGFSDTEDTSMFQRSSGANVRVIQSLEEDTSGVEKAHSCKSILVCTGVFKNSSDKHKRVSTHNHRDFVIDPSLTTPTHLVSDVYEAVKTVFEKEGYS